MRRRIGIGVLIILLVAAVGWGVYRHQHPQRAATTPPATVTAPQTHASSSPSYVDQVLAKMSLRDKVASLFIFHTPGTDPAALASYMTTYQPGGFILMGDNIPATFPELRAETSALTLNKQLPPLIAIDEEGDTVTRLAADTYPGALTLRNGPAAATKAAFAERSALLQYSGVNLNFGIIADVTADPNAFIFPRVLGTTPQAASDRVAAAVTGTGGQTLTTLKHFPGHGETELDSDLTIPTITTSLAEWRQHDEPSFRAGIAAGADVVMFGQLRYAAVDDQPATLSKTWHDIIRNELGFKGLIVTDDMISLQKSGEAAYGDPVQNAIAAVQAGNDQLLYVLDHDNAPTVDPNTLIDGVVAAVQDGRISQASLDAHVRHILTVRHKLGTKL